MNLAAFSHDDDTETYRNVLSNSLFSAFSVDNLNALVRLGNAQAYKENEVIVKEGELVDRIFFIITGKCEVRKRAEPNEKNDTPDQPVAVLNEGESIGLSEAGLYSSTGFRKATVVALSDVVVFCVDIETFRQFLNDIPNKDELFFNQLALLTRMQFIKTAAPFVSIPNQQIMHIAERIEEKSFQSDTTLFEQGATGDACYRQGGNLHSIG